MLSLTAIRRLRLVRALFDVARSAEGRSGRMIGPNGAGKTTLMRVISGPILLRGGAMTRKPVPSAAFRRMHVEQGIAHVPGNRGCSRV